MAEYKGLTIRIGGDTSSLQNALKAATKAAAATQREITQVNRAMRFDPAGVMNVETKMRLLDNRAESVASRMRTLNTSISEMSQRTVRFDGAATKLGDLAESTGNAQLAASRAQKEYADLVETIARTYLGIENVANASDEFVAVWSRFSPEKFKMSDAFARLGDAEFAEVEDALRRIGAVTDDDMERISALRSEFHRLSENNEAAGLVAQLEQAKVQSQLCEAEARDLGAAYARLSTPTLVSGLEEARGEMRLLESQAEQLKADLSSASELRGLDPTNLATAQRYMQDLHDLSQNASEQVRVLRTQLDSFRAAGIDEASEGVGDLATESERAEQAVRKTSVELNAARDALYNARREMQSVDGDTDEARAAVARLEEQVDSLEREFEQASVASSRLTDVGEYRSLSQQLRQAEDAAEGYATQMRNATRQSGGFWDSMRELGYGISGSYTQAVVELGRYSIQAGTDIDSAYRDMRKTVQGTESDFEALKQSAVEFSETNVTSADQVLAIQAIGGELGIATDALDTFAETVSNLSIATNLDVDTAATSLGTLSNILDDLDETHMPNFADALVRLGNNGASTETQIANIAQRIGSMSSIVGMTTPEILAWASTIASTGQGAESAGTAINNTISDIERAVANGTDELDLFAETAGMSAEQFAEAWSKRPSDALQAFIEGLAELEEHQQSATERLSDLGISDARQVRAIEGLMQSISGLDANLMMSQNAWDGVSDSWGQAGDAANEASKKAEGLSGSVSILNNVAQAFAAEAGEAMVPAIHLATDALKALGDGFSALPGWAKTAVVGLVGVTAAAGPVLVGVSQVKNAIDVLRGTTDVMNLTKAIREMGGLGKAVEAAGDVAESAGGAISSGFRLIEGGASSVGKAAASGSKSTGLMSAAVSALGISSGGVTAVLGVLAAAVGTVGVYFAQEAQKAAEAAEQQRRVANATKPLVDLYEDAADSAADYGDAVDGISGSADELVDRVTETNRSFSDGIQSIKVSRTQLDDYIQTMVELAGHTGDNAAAQRRLREAVAGYNQITGESVSIVDAENGTLSANTDQIHAMADAWQDAAEKKQFYAYLDAVENETAEVQVELETKTNARDSLTDKNRQILEEAGVESATDLTGEDRTAYENNANAIQELNEDIGTLEAMYEGLSEDQPFRNAAEMLMSIEGVTADLATDLAYATTNSDALYNTLGDPAALDAISTAFEDSGNHLSAVVPLLEQYGISLDTAEGKAAKAAYDIASAMREMDNGAATHLSNANVNLWEFAEAAEEAGVTSEQIAGVSSTAFAQMARDCGGDVNELVQAIQGYNGTSILDKHGNITADYAELEDANGETYVWNGEQLIDKEGNVVTHGIDELRDGNGVVVEWNGEELTTKEATLDLRKGDETDETVERAGAWQTMASGGPMNVTGQLSFHPASNVVPTIGLVDQIRKNPVVDQEATVSVRDDGVEKAIDRNVRFNGNPVKDQGATSTVHSDTVQTAVDRLVAYRNNRPQNYEATVSITTIKNNIENFSKTFSKTFKNARGGIRAHATGAYIARSATMISPWDVVGEDGAEAIVPLTNRRYSRPFAEQVAEQTGLGEMMGALVAEVSALRSDVQAIDPNLYVDGRQLARATASEYDRALYRQQSRRRL